MQQKETPNYYAILTANVRYAKDLSEFQKLLYAEITALSNKDWYCYASNTYFSDLYWKSKEWISKSIKQMWELWYIQVEHDKEAWNIRRIFIWELAKLKKTINLPIEEKFNSYWRKVQDPIEEKFNHNNIYNNINNNKQQHLEFVWLTEKEYSQLIEEYGKQRVEKYINDLNNYVWQHGDKYKSHYLTILTRMRRAWEKKKEVSTKYDFEEENKKLLQNVRPKLPWIKK